MGTVPGGGHDDDFVARDFVRVEFLAFVGAGSGVQGADFRVAQNFSG